MVRTSRRPFRIKTCIESTHCLRSAAKSAAMKVQDLEIPLHPSDFKGSKARSCDLWLSYMQALANCHRLGSANLTWCVKITDVGLTALASGCPSMGLLSLHGILGVTDAAIRALQQHCATSLHTLDTQGCMQIQQRRRNQLLQMLPHLVCFEVHS